MNEIFLLIDEFIFKINWIHLFCKSMEITNEVTNQTIICSRLDVRLD